jgi:hypothetical protein
MRKVSILSAASACLSWAGLSWAGLSWAGAARASETGAQAEAVAPVPVEAVPCVRPVHFEAPYRWAWIEGGGTIREASAFVVHADPALLAPRDLGQRALLVDGWPAEPLVIDGAWALVLAPVPAAGPHHLWFGDTTLPERTARPVATTVAATTRGLPMATPTPGATHLAPAAPEGLRNRLIAELRPWFEGCRQP